MKSILFLLCLVNALEVFAQQFLPFHKERPVYYQFTGDEVFYTQAAIFIDSFKLSGADTIFFYYPIIDYHDPYAVECAFLAHDTSFVGQHSLRTATGYDLFFTRNGDTLYFRNNADVNESWKMMDLGGDNMLEATVQSISITQVLGIDDSVKKIVLQAKDVNGNNITHLFNGKSFSIGKSSGLVSGYSFFHFPSEAIAFSLQGMDNPSSGLSTENLTPQNVFDFSVGDRFDYYVSTGFSFQSNQEIWKTYDIASKLISSGGDTITYHVDAKYHSKGYNLNGFYDTLYTGAFDWPFALSDFDFFYTKPFELDTFDYINNHHSLESAFYDASATVIFNHPDYAMPGDGDCLDILIDNNAPHETYGIGLGKVWSYSGNMGGPGYWYHEKLTYFNKSGGEWGDSINWIVLGMEQMPQQQIITLFPNPVYNELVISGDGLQAQSHFIVLDGLGNIMLTGQLNQDGNTTLKIDGLPSGIYVLQLTDHNRIINSKFIRQ